MDKLFLSFLGKPNSGKSTLISDLVDYYDDKHNIGVFSGSNLIYEIEKKSKLWKELEPIIKSGKNIPQHIVIELLERSLKNSREEIIVLDNIMPNMEAIDHFIGQGQFSIDTLVSLLPADDLCIERSGKRLICDICRHPYRVEHDLYEVIGTPCAKDDGGVLVRRSNDELIEKRLKDFRKLTLPVIEYFANTEISTLNLLPTHRTTREEIREQASDFLSENFGL